MQTIRLEAEDMTLDTFRLEDLELASGNEVISLRGGGSTNERGTASFDFSGTAGLYDIVIGYFDEGDGVSNLEVRKEGELLDSWDWNQAPDNVGTSNHYPSAETFARRSLGRHSVNSGDSFTLRGIEHVGEPVRVDYIEFIPISSTNNPGSSNSSNPIRLEAEDMTLDTFRLEDLELASGNEVISLVRGASTHERGTASFDFSGTAGLYDIVIGYFDEGDGVSNLEVRKEGELVDSWDWNQAPDNVGKSNHYPSAETFARRSLGRHSVNLGDSFTLRGIENVGEPVRVDYIEFIPISSTNKLGTSGDDTLKGDNRNNLIEGFAGNDLLIGQGGNDTLQGGEGYDHLKGGGGNDVLIGGYGNDALNGGGGIDTADYSDTPKGIIANLATGTVLTPLFGTQDGARIMPLGDSITEGEHTVAPSPGAYRTELWKNLVADGFDINFVGSQSNGPGSLGDKDHEGYGGFTIDEIHTRVSGSLLNTQNPDVILLMIGTNDVLGKGGNSLQGMRSDLSNLIDTITSKAPSASLVVSSIAPIDPTGSKFGSQDVGRQKAEMAEDFNELLQDLIEEKTARGKLVRFANVGGKLSEDDLVSDGVHPSERGYEILGDAWYEAIVKRDTLKKVENLIGSDDNDMLTGSQQANQLKGNAGNDKITGGFGADTLTGGFGADTFVYQHRNDGLDVITDFSANDRLMISASGFGGGLTAGVDLMSTASSTGVFVNSINPTSIGTSANFLYNSNTGLLSFDIDGTHSANAISIATLSGSPSLDLDQFVVV